MNHKPQKLKPDNFTSSTRTPWGGNNIIDHFKFHLPIQRSETINHSRIGESWELSLSIMLPSKMEDGTPLSTYIDQDKEFWFGKKQHTEELLVKLIDTAQPLSIQVHPDDDSTYLKPHECGTWEIWYIVDAKPDATVLFGLREGVTKQMMKRYLQEKRDISPLLWSCVPTPGNLFIISPGTPHSIGKGITLIEVQKIKPNKIPITYRFSDWNRCFDEKGKLNPIHGKPRALHVKQALACSSWNRQWNNWRKTAYAQDPIPSYQTSATYNIYLDKVIGIGMISGNGLCHYPLHGQFTHLFCIRGSLSLKGKTFNIDVSMGESIVIPAKTIDIIFELKNVYAFVSWIPD